MVPRLSARSGLVSMACLLLLALAQPAAAANLPVSSKGPVLIGFKVEESLLPDDLPFLGVRDPPGGGGDGGPGDQPPPPNPDSFHRCIIDAALYLYTGVSSEDPTNYVTDPVGTTNRNKDRVARFSDDIQRCQVPFDVVSCSMSNPLDWANPYRDLGDIGQGIFEVGIPYVNPVPPQGEKMTQQLHIAVDANGEPVASC